MTEPHRAGGVIVRLPAGLLPATSPPGEGSEVLQFSIASTSNIESGMETGEGAPSGGEGKLFISLSAEREARPALMQSSSGYDIAGDDRSRAAF